MEYPNTNICKKCGCIFKKDTKFKMGIVIEPVDTTSKIRFIPSGIVEKNVCPICRTKVEEENDI
jgi:hypothetical protein